MLHGNITRFWIVDTERLHQIANGLVQSFRVVTSTGVARPSRAGNIFIFQQAGHDLGGRFVMW